MARPQRQVAAASSWRLDYIRESAIYTVRVHSRTPLNSRYEAYFSHEVMQCNRYQSTAEVTRCSERRTRLSWVAGAALSVPAPKTLHWSEAYSKEAAQCHASTYLVREMWVRRNVYPNPSNVACSSPTKVFLFELYSFVQCFIVRSNDRYALAVHTDCSATLDDHAFVLVGLPDGDYSLA